MKTLILFLSSISYKITILHGFTQVTLNHLHPKTNIIPSISLHESNLNDIIFECNEKFQHEDRISLISKSFRSGFISIVGKPNMGKSTLLNALLHQNLSVSTHRPQTTRHSILGIVSDIQSQVQLCFLDTPGMISNPAYKLQEGMMEAVKGAVRDADLMLVVTDLESEYNDIEKKDEEEMTQEDVILTSIQKTDKPILVIINKSDLASTLTQDDGDVLLDKTIQKWRQLLPKAKVILPCSAKNKESDPGFQLLQAILLSNNDLPTLFRQLGKPRPGMFPTSNQMWLENEEAKEFIPLGPPMYSMDTLTDRSERFFASEIIRGSIFVTLGKEVPYCCEVRIQQFKEPTKTKSEARIQADILVERDSQRGIVVGKGGKMIKSIGTDARKKLETFLDTKVFLELSVKVDKKWRRNEERLMEYGYLKKKK